MRFLTGILLLCVLPLPALAADVEAVYADFVNQLKLSQNVNDDKPNKPSSGGYRLAESSFDACFTPPCPGFAQVIAGTFFGGHVKFLPGPDGKSIEPSGNGYRLAESSFGQLAVFGQLADFSRLDGFTVSYKVDHELKMLYYDKADDSPDYKKDQAAFFYKTKLYNLTGTRITPNTATIKKLWNPTTYNRALAAADGIAAALRYSPHNPGLRDALLDVLYDIAAAEVILAKELEADALKASMGFPGYIHEGESFAITPEIDYLRQALDHYRDATKPYFNLLTDRMGVGVLIGGRDLTNVVFGYHLFREQQPSRSLYVAAFWDEDKKPKSVLDKSVVLDKSQPKPLFTGYKDLVLLFEIERESARVAAKLAKLLALRGDKGDREEAYKVVGEAQQRGDTDSQVLNGMFKESDLPDIAGSGLKEARDGLAQALTSLSGIKSFLDGKANPLGLDPDFLALVQNDNGDTFDYFKSHFLGKDTKNTLTGPIGDARAKYEQAKQSYETFRQYQDRIGDELLSHRRQFADRLRAIAGCPYPDPPDKTSCYHNPERNSGGEIYLQLKNIELAKQRIEKNAREIANLNSQIVNEIERRGEEQHINNLMAQTYVRYGNRQADLSEEIANINANQAMANGVAAAVAGFDTKTFGAGSIAHGVNSLLQYNWEIQKGQLSAQKERLSAQQSADITYQSDQISAANSKAVVKNLLLGMSTLSIESIEASILLAQDVGRLQALLDERSYLEAQWAEANQELGQRYFADPTHRIIQNRDILDAGQAFDRAQLWVFIIARALAYKWNDNHLTYDGYSTNTVFKLRNASELAKMAEAMFDYDSKQLIGTRSGGQFVSFSLKRDLLGYVDNTEFQSYLNQHIMPNDYKPPWGDFKQVVRLRFSTAKSNPGQTFFSLGRWNEKIDWVAVKIVGGTEQREVMVYLEQSGTAFIRNDTGDIVIYPVRYWHTGSTCQSQFCFKDAFGQAINAVVTPHPMTPPETVRKKEFHEMSPAISTWILEIPILDNGGKQLLNLNEVADIEICFNNYYYTRNPGPAR